MKATLTFGLVLGLVISFMACKKKKNKTEETPEPETPVQYPSYSQLRIGNYWIYQDYQINADGTVVALNQFDSCYVEKDTTIGNYTYTKIRRKNPFSGQPGYALQRDSLHYIVAPGGTVLFSSEDFTSDFGTFYSIESTGDTTSRAQRKMTDKDKQIIAPAGVFITSSMRTTISSWPPNENVTYLNARYAKNTGLITETTLYYPGTKTSIEKRLLRYHLN